jgi:lactoylglutathione lyase
MDKTSLIILVDSVEDTYNSLNKFNLLMKSHNQADWGIKVAHFRDLDDNLIEIYEVIENDKD